MSFRTVVFVALILLSRVALADEPDSAPSPTPVATESPFPVPTPLATATPVRSEFPGTCCSPFCAPSWAVDTDRTRVWLEAGGGFAGTNRAPGWEYGLALGFAIDTHRIIRTSLAEYVDDGSGGRTPSDRFDAFSVEYGEQTQVASIIFSATGGLGYSRGLARGHLLFAKDGERWYRPIQYDAISITGNGFVGIAGSVGAIGFSVCGNANPERQAWAAELTLVYGSILDLHRREKP